MQLSNGRGSGIRARDPLLPKQRSANMHEYAPAVTRQYPPWFCWPFCCRTFCASMHEVAAECVKRVPLTFRRSTQWSS